MRDPGFQHKGGDQDHQSGQDMPAADQQGRNCAWREEEHHRGGGRPGKAPQRRHGGLIQPCLQGSSPEIIAPFLMPVRTGRNRP
jgi:hypothetical protein